MLSEVDNWLDLYLGDEDEIRECFKGHQCVVTSVTRMSHEGLRDFITAI